MPEVNEIKKVTLNSEPSRSLHATVYSLNAYLKHYVSNIKREAMLHAHRPDERCVAKRAEQMAKRDGYNKNYTQCLSLHSFVVWAAGFMFDVRFIFFSACIFVPCVYFNPQ